MTSVGLFYLVLVAALYAFFYRRSSERTVQSLRTAGKALQTMAPLEIGFLGWRFSVIRSLLTILFSVPIGLLLEWTMERGEQGHP